MQSRQCISCKHFLAGSFCRAFYPDPIPEKIQQGWISHNRPIPGDNGFRYEVSENYKMLNFTESTKNTQVLAIHYAKQTQVEAAVEFMSSLSELDTPEKALSVARAFWIMVELSIKDNDSGNEVEGIQDIEFWMYKLFNKVSGYFKKCGYEVQWEQAELEAKSN